MARCTTYTSTDINQLGSLLDSASYSNRTDTLKNFLNKFSQEAVVKLINHPIKRYSGQTSVHLAATNGLKECLKVLLDYGGDPNVESDYADLCQTPLHLAASKGFAQCLQTLLDHGADIDKENTRRDKAIDLVKGKTKCERVLTDAIAKKTSEQQQRVNDGIRTEEAEHKITVYKALYRDGSNTSSCAKHVSSVSSSITLEDSMSVSSEQLNCEIEEKDVVYLASYFDSVELYPRAFELTKAEQADVRRLTLLHGNQEAMAECLSLWRQHNPSTATLKKLLQILQRLGKEEVAVNVHGYYYPKCKN